MSEVVKESGAPMSASDNGRGGQLEITACFSACQECGKPKKAIQLTTASGYVVLCVNCFAKAFNISLIHYNG